MQKKIVNKQAEESLRRSEIEEVTYDNDATYYESERESASYTYEGKKGYGGLLGFFSELNVCATMDHRTGSVAPREGILKQIEEGQAIAKRAGVRIGRLRLDSAGHANKIFRYAKKEKIKYYITLCQNEAVKEIIKEIDEKEWKDYKDTDRKCIESVYVTNEGETVRMIVLRWLKKKQLELFECPYAYHVVGTNDNESSIEEVLEIHNGRMGSENYNKELKSGYNCDWTPSNDITVNANYFYAGVIAYNCVEMIKRYFIGTEVVKYRIKKLRQWLVKQSGQLIKSGRKYTFILINAPQRSYEMFCEMWRRLRYAW